MAVLKVARMGHPVLRQVAKEIPESEIPSERIQRLIDDMVETMHDYHGVGLAAPQVHESIRLSVIQIGSDNPRYDVEDDTGLMVFINPVLKVLDKKEQGVWEGCLSVPGLRGLVFRPRKVGVEYFDRKGERKSLEAEGFFATVLQHEFDHLDGKIYVDRISDMSKFAFDEEYGRYLMEEDEYDEAD